MAVFLKASDVILDDVFLLLSGFAPKFSVYLKLEALNPAGSIKLKTAVSLVDDVARAGLLKPGGRLIESTSGNLGIALSVIAAERGYELSIVTDPNASRPAIEAMRALGTEVVEITERDGNGGYLQSRIDYIRQTLARDPELIWLNQYASIANAEAHRQRTARSIHAELDPVDCLVVGVGSAGTLMGCVEYFARHSPKTRIVAVDAEGSVTFGARAKSRHIPGIGTSRRPELFVDDGRFEKVVISEANTIAMCRRVARGHGLLVGGSTGTALAAVEHLADSIPPGSRVVVISPDLGDRYLSSIYSPAWVTARYPAATALTRGGSVV